MKVHIVKAMVFPVVMYGCESWTIKKAEHQQIDTFDLWCWRRLLRGPWTARRSNQSFLKELNPKYSLEGLMLKLKLQYSSHLMRRADSEIHWKDPDAGKDRRQEEKAMTEDEMVQWHDWLNGYKFEQTPGDGEGQESLVGCSPRGGKELCMTELPYNNKSLRHVRPSFDPMDCSPPGFSVHELSQKEYWSRLPFSSPGESSWPRDWMHIFWIIRRILYHWATREA